MNIRSVAYSIKLAILLLTASTTLAQTADPFANPPADPTQSADTVERSTSHPWSVKNEELKRKLVTPIDVEFFEMPLEEASAYLEERLHIEIHIDNSALEQLGLDSSLPISLELSDVPLRFALEAMLKSNELTYICTDGVLTITSQEEAGNLLETHVYDVHNLINPSQPLESIQALRDLVVKSVDADSWVDVGGPGAITSYQATLVISQTQRNQESIAQLLRELDSAVAAAGGPKLPIRPPVVHEEDRGLAQGGFGGGGFDRGFSPPKIQAETAQRTSHNP